MQSKNQKNKTKIGIIGQGFVGSAIREGLKSFYKVSTYDLDETKCNSTHRQVCLNSDIIFVCLPTPMRKDGSCDTRILESAILKIDSTVKREKNHPIIVVKSTVAIWCENLRRARATKRAEMTTQKWIHKCLAMIVKIG